MLLKHVSVKFLNDSTIENNKVIQAHYPLNWTGQKKFSCFDIMQIPHLNKVCKLKEDLMQQNHFLLHQKSEMVSITTTILTFFINLCLSMSDHSYENGYNKGSILNMFWHIFYHYMISWTNAYFFYIFLNRNNSSVASIWSKLMFCWAIQRLMYLQFVNFKVKCFNALKSCKKTIKR